ncbi:MAG: zinc ribbon domain-containing protein [Abditibacteriota bacterium]|jgi:hypothetical protein|nr:zinc ribbon domain-containing protein [Abditibacteriota bacterium]
MKCPRCGAEYSEGQLWCTKCRLDFKAEEERRAREERLAREREEAASPGETPRAADDGASPSSGGENDTVSEYTLSKHRSGDSWFLLWAAVILFLDILPGMILVVGNTLVGTETQSFFGTDVTVRGDMELWHYLLALLDTAGLTMLILYPFKRWLEWLRIQERRQLRERNG